MPVMILDLSGQEPTWPDIIERGRTIIHLGQDAPPIRVSGLLGGMTSGAPSVAFRLDIDDERTVIAETSLKLFLDVATVLKAKFGEPDIDDRSYAERAELRIAEVKIKVLQALVKKLEADVQNGT